MHDKYLSLGMDEELLSKVSEDKELSDLVMMLNYYRKKVLSSDELISGNVERVKNSQNYYLGHSAGNPQQKVILPYYSVAKVKDHRISWAALNHEQYELEMDAGRLELENKVLMSKQLELHRSIDKMKKWAQVLYYLDK